MDPAFLDNLWKSTDIAAVAAALLPDGRVVRGEEWAAECPYCHSNEKDPRFSVHLPDGLYKCFKCDETGNLITLAQRLWGKSWQKEWAGASPGSAEVLGNPGRAEKPQRAAVKDPSEILQEGRKALDGDGTLLGPLSLAWGIPAPALMSQGWVPVNGGYGLPARDPLNGEVTDVKVRRLPPIPEGQPKSKSLAGSRAGLFGLESLKAKPEAKVLVVEGEKKWAFADYHLPGLAVIGVGMGAGCWVHPAWTEALKGRDVTLAHDHDDAGKKGALKVADFLQGTAGTVRRMGPPSEDPKFDLADLVVEKGAWALAALVDAAPVYAPEFDPYRFMRNRIEGEREQDDVDWSKLGEEAYLCLVRAGAKFIILDGGTCCVYRGHLVKVSGTDKGWAQMMLDLTGLTTVASEGRIIREIVAIRAAQHSVETDGSPAWCVYRNGALYINQSNKPGSQIRITPTTIGVVDNGTDGAITVPNTAVSSIELIPDGEYDHTKAMEATEKLASYFSCPKESREFLRWYLLTVFLYPLSQTHPVIRFRGDSASGKSTCGKAITTVLYGAPYLISSTQAALYRSARRRPLTAIDNLEERDFSKDHELQNFVLVSATGRAREKSASGSDGGVVREEVKSLFLSTGIEPVGIDKPEIVNRTIEVMFDVAHGVPGFYEQGFLDHVVKERTLILNAAMRTAQDTLKDVAGGKLQKVMKTFPADKRRLSEFFCLMSLAQTGGEEVNEIVLGWAATMGADERRTHTEGNPIAPLILAIPKIPPEELGLVWQKTGTFVETEPARAPDLYRAFSYIAKKYGLRMPYGDPQSMSVRLSGDNAKSLEQYGITVERVRTKEARLTRIKINLVRPKTDQELFVP